MTPACRGHLKLDDLPEVEEGDYGWCILVMGPGTPRVVWYDDDDYGCCLAACDPETCPAADEPEGAEVDGHYIDSSAIVYPTDDIRGPWEVVPHLCLRPLPAQIRPWDSRSGKAGMVYAVALVPEVDLCRSKVGFTRSIESRLKAHRTSNPTAVLVGLWPADERDEAIAHSAIDGRIGESEVFVVPDLGVALGKLEELLGAT